MFSAVYVQLSTLDNSGRFDSILGYITGEPTRRFDCLCKVTHSGEDLQVQTGSLFIARNDLMDVEGA